MIFRRLWMSITVVMITFCAVVVVAAQQKNPRLVQPLSPLRNPLPTPHYVAELHPPPGSLDLYNDRVCFSLYDGLPLTTKVDLSSSAYLFRNAVLLIDGEAVESLSPSDAPSQANPTVRRCTPENTRTGIFTWSAGPSRPVTPCRWNAVCMWPS